MPTYEYACRSCGQHLEVVQSFRDEPLTECASCGGGLRKVFSAAGIIFKGSGYYVTDTRAERAGASSGSGESSDGSGESKGGEPAASESKKESSEPKKEGSSTSGSSSGSESAA